VNAVEVVVPGRVEVVVSAPDVDVGGSVVLVGGSVLLVVGGRVVVVGGAVVGAGARGRRAGRAVVGVTASTALWTAFLAGWVVACTAEVPGADGVWPEAVSRPSALPPPAPSTTATASVANRRSTLNRTKPPGCATYPDDKPIGWRRGLLDFGTPAYG
jgi:hypothetical protein